MPAMSRLTLTQLLAVWQTSFVIKVMLAGFAELPGTASLSDEQRL